MANVLGSLAPGFLIASPPLGDPNFDRTVVLLALHGDEGAMGFVMNRLAPLVKAFEEKHQEYKGKIYWETIPPGLLVKQMKTGGTITSSNMTWTAKPDAYLAGLVKVKQLIEEGRRF